MYTAKQTHKYYSAAWFMRAESGLQRSVTIPNKHQNHSTAAGNGAWVLQQTTSCFWHHGGGVSASGMFEYPGLPEDLQVSIDDAERGYAGSAAQEGSELSAGHLSG